MRLEVRDVSVALRRKPIVSGASLAVGDGEFVGLFGPNGSGKSTLLRAIYRTIKGYTGEVLWDGRDSRFVSQREFARKVAVVSQFNTVAFDFSVREVVALGRSPHLGMLSRESDRDDRIVAESIRKVDLPGMADRAFASLSGGERQRVMLARALAQEPAFLVLDEPTNHLDIKHQINILQLVRDLGIGCLAALHDIAMASQFVDRLYFMKDGKIVREGEPHLAVTSESLHEVYGVEGEVSLRGRGVSIEYRYPSRTNRTSG